MLTGGYRLTDKGLALKAMLGEDFIISEDLCTLGELLYYLAPGDSTSFYYNAIEAQENEDSEVAPWGFARLKNKGFIEEDLGVEMEAISVRRQMFHNKKDMVKKFRMGLE